MKRLTLNSILKSRAHKQAVVRAVGLTSHKEVLIDPLADDCPEAFRDAAQAAMMSDKSGVHAIEGEDYFLNVFNPPLRLIIVGAVHIAQPLASMAQLAGYDLTIIDPRESFASPERFPDMAISHDWPDEAVKAFGPDHRTSIVTLTHDPKIDDPALQAALNSPCFYIGALGSNKTHKARLDRLREAGFTDEQMSRINGPVGLDIGAKCPAEIAISIMAQMTEALRKGTKS